MMHTSGGNVLTGWLALLLAGLLEVSWAISLKYSDESHPVLAEQWGS